MKGFEGEDGEDTGHDIKNEAAEKCEEESEREVGGSSGGGRGGEGNRDTKSAVAGGVPRFFSDEKTRESFRNLCLWLEGNFYDQLIVGLFDFCGLELIDVIAF